MQKISKLQVTELHFLKKINDMLNNPDVKRNKENNNYK